MKILHKCLQNKKNKKAIFHAVYDCLLCLLCFYCHCTLYISCRLSFCCRCCCLLCSIHSCCYVQFSQSFVQPVQSFVSCPRLPFLSQILLVYLGSGQFVSSSFLFQCIIMHAILFYIDLFF